MKTKVEALVAEWRELQKSAKRGGATQQKLEKEFLEKLDNLFDIAHADAFDKIKNPEDAEFLRLQREKGRPGCMAGADTTEFNIRKRRSEREEKNETRKKRAKVQSQEATVGECY